MNPIVINAYECPKTGKVFTDLKTFEKHAASVKAEEEKKAKEVDFKKRVKRALATATSFEELFERMTKLINESGKIVDRDGKKVKIELQVINSGCRIAERYGKASLFISQYQWAKAKDISISSSSIEHIIPGFHSGSGGYHSNEWVDVNGKYQKGYVCRYDCSFELNAIPGIIKNVKRFAKISVERKTWETEKTSFGETIPNLNLEKISELTQKKDDLQKKIDELRSQQNVFIDKINMLHSEHTNNVMDMIDIIKKEEPFKHEKEFQKLKDFPDIERLSKFFTDPVKK